MSKAKPTAKTPPVLQLEKVNKAYAQGQKRLNVLQQISLQVQAGETIALVGPSGCGKSTLLQIAGLLDAPDSGEVLLSGVACAGANEAWRTEARRERLGFVYQYHHLLPEFSAVENVALPQMIAGVGRKEAEKKAATLLGQLGLKQRAQHRPAELSGGEQQRVAIARALANDPVVLLADEPTGNLDPTTAQDVFDLLLQRVRERGLALVMVTHNPALAKTLDRQLVFKQGKLVKG